jgi:hypothetical protein
MPKRALPALLALLCVVFAACGKTVESPPDGREQPDEVVLTPEDARAGRAQAREELADAGSKARAVELRGAGAQPDAGGDPKADAPSPGAPTDADVRAELRQARRDLQKFKHYLGSTAFLRTGPVARVILAGNQIAKFPYKWGGGHGAWRDNGYDCSGSVSFALAGAGLLDAPMTSGNFVDYGEAGAGQWITIYANGGHIFMIVAGLRFDTSGQGRAGTRWQEAPRPTGGFAVRHPPGL